MPHTHALFFLLINFKLLCFVSLVLQKNYLLLFDLLLISLTLSVSPFLSCALYVSVVLGTAVEGKQWDWKFM